MSSSMVLNTFETGLLSALVISFIIQMIFYWVVLARPYYYMRTFNAEKLQELGECPPVSVIINIKESTSDLKQFLKTILEQDYPEFEVIVITDEISDEDEKTLIRLKKKYVNLYSTHVPEDTRNISRKKLALTLGIKAAKHDTLLFTESDSRIRSKDWIYLTALHFSKKKTIVLGFSAFENTTGLSHKFAAYDYFFSNLQMISLALLNHPYAGNGRNMAYAKSHFIEQKGFVKYRTLQQGADDLFINEIATGENTAVELSAQSVAIVEMNDLRNWKQLKADRMSSQKFYKRGTVAFWRLECYSRIGFIAAVVVSVIYKLPYAGLPDLQLPGIALVFLLVRFLSQMFVVNKTADRLQAGKFYLTIPAFDLLQPFVNFYFYIYRIIKGKNNYTYLYEKR